MNLLIFYNVYEFFQFFYVLEKNSGYNRGIVSSVPRKILVCDMESLYKKIFKIRNVMLIFQNFQKNLQKRKKQLKKFK